MAATWLLAVSACRESGGDEAAVVLTVDMASSQPRPAHLVIEWFTGGQGSVFSRVPSEGTLPPAGSPLARVRYQLSAAQQGPRKAVVRAFDADGRVVAIDAHRIPFAVGTQDVLVQLVPSLPDGDDDGVPDAVDDDCPWTPCPLPRERPDAAGADSAAGTDTTDGGVDGPAVRDVDGPAVRDEVPTTWTVRPELGTGLVGYWSLDELPGSAVARDLSGNQNHGTLVGLDPAGAWARGIQANALDFTRTGAVRVEPSASLDRIKTALTVGAWVSSRNPASATAVLSRHLDGTSLELYYLQISHGFAQFIWNTAVPPGVTVRQGTRIPAQAWLHLAATWDGTTARLYINGREADRGTTSMVALPATNTPLFIGANANDAQNVPRELFSGMLDEIVLYERALSAEEIGWLATGALPPSR